jgi:hypothetical protein
VRDSSTIKAKPLELVRTVKVELLASDESRAALRQLPPLITAAMQDAVGIASDHRFRNYEAFHHADHVPGLVPAAPNYTISYCCSLSVSTET